MGVKLGPSCGILSGHCPLYELWKCGIHTISVFLSVTYSFFVVSSGYLWLLY